MSVKVALVGAVVITEGTSERLLFLMDTRDVVLHSYPLSKALLDQIQIQITYQLSIALLNRTAQF